MSSLFVELKRRNVFRVVVAYAIVSWLIMQVADMVVPVLGIPDWSLRLILLLLMFGFPIAVILAWAFEMTPDGIKREKDVDRGESITPQTGNKLDRIIIGVLVVAVAYFAVDKFLLTDIGGGSIVEQTTDDRSIAVLPFTNMSADADNEYFADGISEEILNLLADVRDLEVASRTSAFAFKGKDTPIPEIARQLDVRYVLEGSVRKSRDQVRITAQLIDASSDRHLWSETYDRTLDDIFVIQDEIAAAIGRELKIQLLGSKGEAVTAESLDPKIYAQFLEARYRMRRRSDPDILTATKMLEQVVEKEPEFARGHVVLGEVYLLGRGRRDIDMDPAELERRARQHAKIAEGLAPELSGIYLVYAGFGDTETTALMALGYLDKAIALEPDEPRPYHWRGIRFAGSGYLDFAMRDLSKAVELEPDNANANGYLSTVYAALGDYDEAVKHAELQATLGNPYGYNQAGYFELMRGDTAAAIDSFERTLRALPEDDEWTRLIIEALRDPNKIPVFLEAVDDAIQIDAYEVYYILLTLKLYDEFFDAVSKRGVSGNIPTAIWSDLYSEIRKEDQFLKYMEQRGVLDIWREFGPPPDCRADGDTFSCGHGSGG